MIQKTPEDNTWKRRPAGCHVDTGVSTWMLPVLSKQQVNVGFDQDSKPTLRINLDHISKSVHSTADDHRYGLYNQTPDETLIHYLIALFINIDQVIKFQRLESPSSTIIRHQLARQTRERRVHLESLIQSQGSQFLSIVSTCMFLYYYATLDYDFDLFHDYIQDYIIQCLL